MRLEVYCRRFGRNEIYQIERTPNGWRFKHMATEGDCTKVAVRIYLKTWSTTASIIPKASAVIWNVCGKEPKNKA